MGVYINPPNQTKEEWLRDNSYGEPNFTPPASYDSFLAVGFYWVCLVRNPQFSAAAIAVDNREFQQFTDPNDFRPKLWYLVEKEKLMDPNISPLANYLTDDGELL